MLLSLANQLNSSPWKRHLFFLAAALASLLAVGYHYGTFDMGIHIPFLKTAADPSLFPNDAYIALRSTYFSYFWFFFIPFERAGLLEETFFVTHFVSVYLIFWAIWELSVTLFRNPLSSLFSVLAFVIPHLGFVGFPVVEFGVMSRTFVLPFALFSINLFLKRRTLLAFFLAGLMYNLHVVTVNFVLAMFLLDCVLEFKRIGLKNILLGLAGFIVAALPILVWRSGAAPVDFSLRPEWYTFLEKGILLNVFALFSAYPQIIFLTLSGFSALGLFLIARKSGPDASLNTTAQIFVLATMIILLVGQIMAYWLPVTILIQSQINRAGLFMLILAYLYFANSLALRYQSDTGRDRLAALSLAFFIFPTPIVPALAWLAQKILPCARRVQIGLGLAVLVAFGVAIAISLRYDLWHPGWEIYAQDTPWVDVQEWARDNTSKDTVFITPPQRFYLYESDWRVYSERSTVATYSELLVAAFNPQYTETWTKRFDAVAPGAIPQFNGDYFTNARLAKEAYYALPAGSIQKLACEYKASYIVMEKPHSLPYPLAYQNAEFEVYDLRAQACAR